MEARLIWVLLWSHVGLGLPDPACTARSSLNPPSPTSLVSCPGVCYLALQLSGWDGQGDTDWTWTWPFLHGFGKPGWGAQDLS